MQRIYLLPTSIPSSPSTYPPKGSDKHGEKEQEPRADVRMVYAPVPLDSLPLEMQVQAMEAWVHTGRVEGYGHARAYAYGSGSGSERERERERRDGQRVAAVAAASTGSHQRHKSHRRRSSSVLNTAGQQGYDLGKREV
jgi:hypothetical protein